MGDDKVIISGAPTGLQRNWLLLQCVISLSLLTFCQLVQQSQPEVFQQLITGM